MLDYERSNFIYYCIDLAMRFRFFFFLWTLGYELKCVKILMRNPITRIVDPILPITISLKIGKRTEMVNCLEQFFAYFSSYIPKLINSEFFKVHRIIWNFYALLENVKWMIKTIFIDFDDFRAKYRTLKCLVCSFLQILFYSIFNFQLN